MKRRTSLFLPIPVDGDLKTLVRQGASRTHLSQAEFMRTALRIGGPELIKRLTEPVQSRLINLDPWAAEDLARAYSNKKVDADYAIAASIGGQSRPKD
jgi:hypothetical protein